MVEISKIKIGDCEHKQFTILNDGFQPSGFVQMDCRLSDMKSEGESFFMSVTDQTQDKKGDYAPLEMDKKELKQFIDYLQGCYGEIN